VSEGDRAEEIFLGHFVAAAFDHHHGIHRARDDDLHAAGLVLWQGRVDDELAIVTTDANRGDVFIEGNIGYGQCRACGTDCEDVGIEFGIDREDRGDDLNVVLEAFGEQRTDRPVDLARGEHAVLGGAPLTLDIAAGNLSGCVHLLFEIAREWKEVDAFTRFLGGGNGGEDDVGIAVADESGTVGLLR